MFGNSQIDPSAIVEGDRLARRAAGIWLVGFGVSTLLAVLSGSGGGEMAMLGAFALLVVILVLVATCTAMSLKLAIRALRLNRDSVLARSTLGLNVVSTLYVIVVGALILGDLVG